MSKKFLCLITFLLTAVFAFAQELTTIKGNVKDETGKGAIGAFVMVKGTNNGTSTDADGNFILTAGKGETLVISLIGYKTREITVTGESLNVKLEIDSEMLEDVVVIGYGTQKKQAVSGAVASVSSEKLQNISVSNSAEALQGLAPGLSVNYGSGAPGSEPSLMVRGITSWGSDNDPLVIIDGVPGSMSYLNPEDIKSVSVLKDAATSAIYGSRAAAGVILVETKRGEKAGEPKISVSAYCGIDDLPKKMDICNASEFIQVRQWALTNAGISEDSWPRYIAAYKKDPTQFADTDWQKEYYRMGLNQKYDLSYTAGTENVNVSFSGYYSDTKGIAEATGSNKMGFRLNSDVKRGIFKIGESVSYGYISIEPEENSGFDAMYQVTNLEPLVSLYDSKNEGGYGGAIAGMDMSDAGNPVAFNNLIDTKYQYDHISASAYVQATPVKGLVLKFQGGDNMDFYHYKSFKPTYKVGVQKNNPIASLSESRSKTNKYLLEFTANYDATIAEKHNFSVLAGLSQEETKYFDLGGSANKFENNDMNYLEHGQKDFAVSGGAWRYALRSAFGRLNYNFDNKYLAMASVRYDGSTRFAEGNKWGFFPSASLAWNIANEGFWEPVKKDVSTLKLRLSYGALGNQGIGNYKYIPTLTSGTNSLNYPFSGNDISLGYAVTSLPSSNIKWESTYTSNIGLDAGFFGDRLQLTADFYVKKTKDMLSEKKISSCTGYASMIVNDGELKTTGAEVQINYRGGSNDKLLYNLELNLSNYKSKLTSMSNPDYLYEYGPARTYVGGEIGEMWVYKTLGIFQSQAEVDSWNKEHGYKDAEGTWYPLQPNAEPGDIRFSDENGDGSLSTDDKVKDGSGNPKLVLGFNAYLRYRNFDLSANFYGNFGVKRFNYTKLQLQRMDQVFNYGKDALNSWRPDNTDTDVPRAVQGDPNGNNRISDRYLENGAFLTLNNLQIGYNLPQDVCKKLRINNLRFYVGGTRLFTLTGYSGYDPSTGSTNGQMGVDYGGYPLYRTYMLGMKFGF
ncbi:MAG: TonB-dependent receptor [Bacteroidales bacterium]